MGGEDPEDEYMQFFGACDDDGDGRFTFEDFENYCLLHGEAIVNQTLKLLEDMFDGVIEETGIIITDKDVKNNVLLHAGMSTPDLRKVADCGANTNDAGS